MIAKIFSKANPMNFVIGMFFLLTAFVITLISKFDFTGNIQVLSVFPILAFSVFLMNFISQKNKINKSNSYAILIFTMLLLLIPESFLSFSVVLSNLFVLLAFRKLVSLQSGIQPKQKIFDASVWIAVASVFEFWSVLFFALVFVSILIHVSNDFRNWLIPFVGAFAVVILVALYAFIIDFGIIDLIWHNAVLDFNFGAIHSFALGTFMIVMLLLLIFQIAYSKNYLAKKQNAIKKVIALLVIGFLVYLFSNEKNNGLLLYCVAPLSIIGSNFINSLHRDWLKDTYIAVLLILSCISFYLYL